MPKPPDTRRRIVDPREAAEAAFKTATAKPIESPVSKALPGPKQLVSVRVDADVLEHFQSAGADWQERVNAALRKAAFG